MLYDIKGNYFHGKFHLPPTSGPQSVDTVIKRECPADTDTILWSMPVEYRHVDPVVESAVSGFDFWRKVKVEDRIIFLKRYQEQVIARKEEMAEAISLESGKPIWEARGEVQSVIGKVDVTINDSYPRVKNLVYENIMPETRGHVVFKPLGVCLVIGPFNFPCHLANTQILSALITGNSIIFKPSEKTAYSAQIMAECFHNAGFPNGVFNLIQGDGEIARRLLKHKPVRGIYFTGSKEVGQKIIEATHSDFSKLVALELGGKNPAIVHSDANVELALEELVKGCYLTSGQRCTSTATIILHETLINSFVDRFHELSKRIIVDHPTKHERAPFMGPLVDQKALDNYLLFMGMAKREGIKEVMRGKQLSKNHKGYYVSPSIHLAEEFKASSHFLMSEIFGPNCTIIPYRELTDAIKIANATEYGLAACVFTKSRDVFEQCSQDIDTGLINLNRSTCGASPKLPFGGAKNSGNYHPMAVASIDACVYQMSSLEAIDAKPTGTEGITGLMES